MIRVAVTIRAMPVSGEIRHAVATIAQVLGPQLEGLRGPVLAFVGTGALAFSALSKRQVQALRKAECGGDDGSSLYNQLSRRGEETLARVRAQPAVARVLRRAGEVSSRLTKSFEGAVDEVHDATEEALGRLSLLTSDARPMNAIKQIAAVAFTPIRVRLTGDHPAGPSRALGDTDASGPGFRQAAPGAQPGKRPRAEQKHQRGERVGGPEENALASQASCSATSQTPTLARTASAGRRRSRAESVPELRPRRASVAVRDERWAPPATGQAAG